MGTDPSLKLDPPAAVARKNATAIIASTTEAADLLKKTLNAPMSVPVQIINLTQLGDEACLSHSDRYSKDGQSNLFFRKGRFVVIMSGSTPGLAQRFAKHMADEIGN